MQGHFQNFLLDRFELGDRTGLSQRVILRERAGILVADEFELHERFHDGGRPRIVARHRVNERKSAQCFAARNDFAQCGSRNNFETNATGSFVLRKRMYLKPHYFTARRSCSCQSARKPSLARPAPTQRFQKCFNGLPAALALVLSSMDMEVIADWDGYLGGVVAASRALRFEARKSVKPTPNITPPQNRNARRPVKRFGMAISARMNTPYTRHSAPRSL